MKRIVLLYILFQLTYFSNLTGQISWDTPVDVAISAYGNDYPRIAINSNGESYITWGGSDRVWFSKNTVSGFIDPIQLNNDSTNAFVASWTGPDLAVRNDTIYTCFMHRDWGRKSYLVKSFDNGATFSHPILIENYQDSASRFPTVTFDIEGNPLVALMKMGLNGGHPQYVVRKSVDGGDTFIEEEHVGGWSGSGSEACDCCPAAIKSYENKVVVLYRDNLENIRDIYATISSDYGATFDNGFPVDDNFWQIFSCPASGPDGVIIGDTLYSVFFSKKYSYLSRADLKTGNLISVEKLGALAQNGTQNFPRIDNYGNQVAIVWREFAKSNKIFIAYTDDIVNNNSFVFDTVYFGSCSNADVAIGPSGIHVVVEDLVDGTVKYIKGNYQTSNNINTVWNEIKVYPNPSSQILYIEGLLRDSYYQILDTEGRLIFQGTYKGEIDISSLKAGWYFIELSDHENPVRKVFIKN